MKNMKIYALAGVAALAVVGGTFAYYNASQTFNNPFDTSNYGTYAMEEFNPAEGHNWEPGVEVDKKVFATNTGKGDVWVRISLDEVWENLNSDATDKKLAFAYNELWRANPDSGTTAKQNNAEDGLVAADKNVGSVVYKEFDKDAITQNLEEAGAKNWYYKDGYFYYTKTLAQNQVTPDLLKTVTLCGDTDMGKFVVKNYYKIDAKGIKTKNDDGSINQNLVPYDADGNVKSGWTPYEGEMVIETVTDAQGNKKEQVVIKNGETSTPVEIGEGETVYTYKDDQLAEGQQGYANANYKLNIKVEFVQADVESAKAFNPEVGTKWAFNPEEKTEIDYTAATE